MRRKLKVNAGKSKRIEMTDLNALYMISIPAVGICEVVIGDLKIVSSNLAHSSFLLRDVMLSL